MLRYFGYFLACLVLAALATALGWHLIAIVTAPRPRLLPPELMR